MRVLIVHNRYGRPSGEEAVVDRYGELLRGKGHEVRRFERTSASLGAGILGRCRGFLSGLGNPWARAALRRELRAWRPDVVNVHNVFPLISPLALEACTEASVPVLMTVHNFRLICPNGLLYANGATCDRCVGGREIHCVLRNCEQSRAKSLGYAFRSAIARWRGSFAANVSVYAALTEFQRERLIAGGIDARRITVVPNGAEVPADAGREGDGDFVAYVGRLSESKGVGDLVAAARCVPQVPVRLFGPLEPGRRLRLELPGNVRYMGPLDPQDVPGVYRRCRVLVVPSRWYEGFPMVAVEALARGCAVIGPRHGGFPEILEDGRSGWLFRPGDHVDLGRVLAYAWQHPDACAAMGQAGRARVVREYSIERWGDRLVAALEMAIRRGAA